MTDIGSLVASIGADISDLKRSVKLADTELKNHAKNTDRELGKADKRWAKAIESVSTYEKKVKKDLRDSQNDFKTYARKTERELKQAINSFEQYERKVKTELKQATNSINKFERSTKTSLTKVDSHWSKVGKSFNAFAKTVKAAALGYATVLATMQISEFTVGIVKAGVALDSLERSFKAITGSSSAAQVELAFVNKTAKSLGLSLNSLEQSYKNILAASRDTKLEGRAIRDVFTAVSQASAVLGLSADDTSGTLRALSQMISKGTVQAEELRGQLGERLPGAFQMAAEAMGVTTRELGKMLENGEVLATDLLPKLAGVLTSKYGQAAKESGDRAGASFENLRTSVIEFQRVLASSGITDYFVSMAQKITNVIDAASRLLDTAEALRKKVSGVSENVVAYSMKDIDALIENQKRLMLKESFDTGSVYQKDIDDGIKKMTELRKILTDLQELRTIRIDIENLDRVAAAIDSTQNLNYKEIKENIIAAGILAQTNAKMEQKLLEDKHALQRKLSKYSLTEIEAAWKTHIDKLQKLDDYFRKSRVENIWIVEKEQSKVWQDEIERMNKIIAKEKKAYEERLEKEKQDREKTAEEKKQLEEYFTQSRIDNIWIVEEERAKAWQDEIEMMNKMVAKEKKAYEKKLKDAEKEAKKAIKEQEKAYQHMYDNIHDINATMWENMLDGGEGVFDSLLQTAKKTFAQILADWSTPIVMNLVQSTTGGVMNSVTGSIGKSMFGGDGGISNLFSGGASNISDMIGTMSIDGIWGSAGGAVEAGTGLLSGPTGIQGILAGLGPSIVMGAGALVLSKVMEKWGADPGVGFYGNDKIYGSKFNSLGEGEGYETAFLSNGGLWSEKYGYRIDAGSTGQDAEMEQQLVDYFDNYFTTIDTLVSDTMKDSLERHSYVWAGGEDASPVDLSKNVFKNLLPTMLVNLFPDEETLMKTFSEITGGSYKYQGTYIATGEGSADNNRIWEGIYEDITVKTSVMAERFNEAFFAEIMPEGGTEWDGFIRFATAVKESEDFLSAFDRQVEEFGESNVKAMENIESINTIMTVIDDGLKAITDTTYSNNIEALKENWKELYKTLEDAHAITEELTKAKKAENIAIGAQLTGITATTLQGVITGKGDLSTLLKAGTTAQLTSSLAESLMTDIFTDMNEQAGIILERDGMEAAAKYISEFDLTPAVEQIDELKVALGGVDETAEDVTKAMTERADLERQLLTLQGDTNALRQLELDALDESNHELQKTIWAIQDIADAVEQLATAEKALSDFTTELEDQLTTIGMTSTQKELYDIKKEYQDNVSQIEALDESIAVAQAGFDNVTSGIDLVSNQLSSIEEILIAIRAGDVAPTGGTPITSGGAILTDMWQLLDAFQNPVAELTGMEKSITDAYNFYFHRNPEAEGMAHWLGSGFAGSGEDSSLWANILGGASDTESIYGADSPYVAPKTSSELLMEQYGLGGLSEITPWIQRVLNDLPAATAEAMKGIFIQKGLGDNTFDFSGRPEDAPVAPATASVLNTATRLMAGQFAASFSGFMDPIKSEFDQLDMTDLEKSIARIRQEEELRRDSLSAYEAAGVISSTEFDEQLGYIEAIAQAQIDSLYSAEDQRTLADLESKRNTAKADYLAGLNRELAILEGKLNDAKSVYLGLLGEELDAQKQLADTLKSAIKDIKDYRRNLYMGADSPLSMSKRQEELMLERTILSAQAMAGYPDSIAELLSVSSDYLGVTKSMSRNAIEYAKEVAYTNNILKDVEDSAEDQLSEAEQQVKELQAIVDGVNETTDAITDMDEARTAYEDAQKALEDSGYEGLIKGLSDAVISIDELKAAFLAADAAVVGAGGSSSAGSTTSPTDLKSELRPMILDYISDHGASAYNQLVATSGASGNAELYDVMKSQGYADGGIFSGPKSGYPVMAKFHGDEAIIPLDRLDKETLVQEVRLLRQEVSNLREENKAHSISLIKSSQNIETNTEELPKWETIGLPAERA